MAPSLEAVTDSGLHFQNLCLAPSLLAMGAITAWDSSGQSVDPKHRSLTIEYSANLKRTPKPREVRGNARP